MSRPLEDNKLWVSARSKRLIDAAFDQMLDATRQPDATVESVRVMIEHYRDKMDQVEPVFPTTYAERLQ